jgi:hypothetical protein
MPQHPVPSHHYLENTLLPGAFFIKKQRTTTVAFLPQQNTGLR